jgi:hypothetical protein
MNSYPRIKEFEFDINKTASVLEWQVGRLDLVALDLYGDTRFYKALAAANQIRVRGGYRVGIRPNREALISELQRKGVSATEIPAIVDEKLLNARSNNLDWDSYNNITYGYVSDTYGNRLLYVPTFESADAYLQRYEYINPDNNREGNS